MTRTAFPPGAGSDAERSANLLRRGLKLHGSGKIDEAAALYLEAVQLTPNNPEALHLLGVARLAQHRLNDALDLLSKAIALAPDNHQYLANMGVALNSAASHQRAILVLDRAIAIRPDAAEAYSNRGMAYRGLGLFDEAVDSYEHAIRLKPGEAGFHFNQANALEEAGRPHEALEAMQQALRLRPRHQGATVGRIRLLETLRRHDDALAAAEAAAAAMPESTRVLESLASILYRTRNVARAAAVHRQVLDMDPANGQALLGLTRVRRYSRADPEIATLERVFSDPEAATHSRVLAGFGYGKVLCDIGEHQLSRDVYVTANALRRQEQPYQLSQALAAIDRISGQFDTVRPAAPLDGDGNQAAPIFVVGLPRSGKTTIELLLSSTPGTWPAGELGHLRRVVRSLLQVDGTRRGDPLTDFDLQNVDPAALRAGGKQYLDHVMALAPQGTVAIDTLPTNFMMVGFIRQMLPGARIVHAMRDPLEHAVALFEKPFRQPAYGYTSDLSDLQRYYAAYRDIMSTWDALYPGAILHIDVEELRHNPQRASELFAFCGLIDSTGGRGLPESEPRLDDVSEEEAARRRARHAEFYRRDLAALLETQPFGRRASRSR